MVVTQSCLCPDAIRSGPDRGSKGERPPEHPSHAARQPPRREEDSGVTAQEPLPKHLPAKRHR